MFWWQKVKDVENIPALVVWEGDCVWIFVHDSPYKFLDAGPFTLTHSESLDAQQFLDLIFQVREEWLEHSYHAVEYLGMEIRPALQQHDNIINMQ